MVGLRIRKRLVGRVQRVMERKLEIRRENLGGLDHARSKGHGKDCVHGHSFSQYLLDSCLVLVMEGLTKLQSSFKVLGSSGRL